MKFGSLFSGGKDSVMALYRAMEIYEVNVLLSMIPKRSDSYMYHFPNIELTEYASNAIGIPLVKSYSGGKPPQENIDLKEAMIDLKKRFAIDGIITGAVHSNYQYNIISNICKELDLEAFSPYWQEDHGLLIKDAIDAGFEIIIVGVAAHGLDDSWLGKRIDKDSFEELKRLSDKFGIDIGGEGGEYETMVVDGPIFKRRLEIAKSSKEWDGVRGQLLIQEIRPVDKIPNKRGV